MRQSDAHNMPIKINNLRHSLLVNVIFIEVESFQRGTQSEEIQKPRFFPDHHNGINGSLTVFGIDQSEQL